MLVKRVLKVIVLVLISLICFSGIETARAQEKPEIFVQLKHTTGIVYSVAISPDGRYALSGSKDNTLKLWDIKAGKLVRTFKGHTNEVLSVAISPDGKYALSGSLDNTLKLWDIETGKLVRTFKGHTDYVCSVAFSPDGRYALSGSYDKTINLWDIETGKLVRTFEGHRDTVYSVAFSPDGRYALSGSADKTLKLWDIETGKEIRTFRGHTSGVRSVAISPDGRYALSGSHDKIVNLWNMETGKRVRTFEEHTDLVFYVAFSPDGRYTLSGSKDNTLKLWDVKTGREIRTFRGHTSYVFSVAFSPDGRYALSGSDDGTTRIWDIHTGKEIAMLVSFTDGEWVVVTPEGYFNASTNGEEHLKVRVGNKVYFIYNFYEKFFNPDYVASVLQGKKVEAVADIRKGISTPPEVKIISLEQNKEFSTDTITITVSAKDTGGGIDEIRLYHNGKAVGEDTRGVKIIPKRDEVIKNYTVTLVDGINTFRAVGYSKDRTESNPYELIIKRTLPKK